MAVAVKTQVTLDGDLRERVEKLAARQQRSAGLVVAQAVAEYVAREERRKDFATEAGESLAEFRANGLHLTMHEVEDWLDTWGGANEAGPPPCHRRS